MDKKYDLKENDDCYIVGDTKKYIIQKVGEFNVCTIVHGSIKKKVHISELKKKL